MREAREWIVPSSVLKFKGGRGFAPVVNVTDNQLHFHQGQRLGHVEPLASAGGEILMMESPSEGAAMPICVENATPLETFKIGTKFSEDRRLGLWEALTKHRECFRIDGRHYGTTTAAVHQIMTTCVQPIREGPRHLTPLAREEVRRQVSEMLEEGVA